MFTSSSSTMVLLSIALMATFWPRFGANSISPSEAVNEFSTNNSSTTYAVASSTESSTNHSSLPNTPTDSFALSTKTTTPTTTSPLPNGGASVGNRVFWYFVMAVGCLVVLIASFILFVYCKRRIRLDKLRHQLMPLYNYDPHETDEWETELLTENREGPAYHSSLDPKESTVPPRNSKLSFREESLDLPP